MFSNNTNYLRLSINYGELSNNYKTYLTTRLKKGKLHNFNYDKFNTDSKNKVFALKSGSKSSKLNN